MLLYEEYLQESSRNNYSFLGGAKLSFGVLEIPKKLEKTSGTEIFKWLMTDYPSLWTDTEAGSVKLKGGLNLWCLYLAPKAGELEYKNIKSGRNIETSWSMMESPPRKGVIKVLNFMNKDGVFSSKQFSILMKSIKEVSNIKDIWDLMEYLKKKNKVKDVVSSDKPIIKARGLPKQGITKKQIFSYYRNFKRPILNWLDGRKVSTKHIVTGRNKIDVVLNESNYDKILCSTIPRKIETLINEKQVSRKHISFYMHKLGVLNQIDFLKLCNQRIKPIIEVLTKELYNSRIFSIKNVDYLISYSYLYIIINLTKPYNYEESIINIKKEIEGIFDECVFTYPYVGEPERRDSLYCNKNDIKLSEAHSYSYPTKYSLLENGLACINPFVESKMMIPWK